MGSKQDSDQRVTLFVSGVRAAEEKAAGRARTHIIAVDGGCRVGAGRGMLDVLGRQRG